MSNLSATPFTTTALPTASLSTVTVRIIRDPASKDGWVAKTKKGKVCFIDNLGKVISQLQPGQVWRSKVIRHKPTFFAVELVKQLSI